MSGPLINLRIEIGLLPRLGSKKVIIEPNVFL
jgi:hypothetical protein